MKMRASVIVSVVVLGVLLGCHSPQGERRLQATSANPGISKPSGAASYSIPPQLVELNKLFLCAYQTRQGSVISNASPVIVSSFASLILYRNGTAETNRVIPDLYHSLKAVAHVPFGLYLRVQPHVSGGAVPTELIVDLRLYRERIAAAQAALTGAGFSPEQMTRQQTVLRRSDEFIGKVMVQGNVQPSEVADFARSLGPLMLANANDAAALQLDAMHEVVMRWKKRIPRDEWSKLIVVVRGMQMARRLNISTQYFAKVLNEPEHKLGYPLESRRLIYAEFILKDRDHMDLLATTFIDGDASEAFFGDRWRMSRDVLADGAKEHLKRLRFD
jgi:hypothetical protein